MTDIEGRLAAVEARLAALEPAGPVAAAPPHPSGGTASAGDRWWLLDRLTSYAGPGWESGGPGGLGGAIALGGVVRLPDGRRYVRQVEHPAQAVLEVDLSRAAEVLAALGHPVRLQLLRAMLRGADTLAELCDLPDLGTTGQVNHHLRELRAAGLVESGRRNHYAVVTDRVVPLLAMLAAAVGPTAISSTSTPSEKELHP